MGDFDDFCGGSPIWNETLLLESSYPKFTSCFVNTLLVWVPCGLLWISFPIYTYLISTQLFTATIPVQPLNVLKTIVSVLLCAVSIVQVIRHGDDSDTPPSLYVADGIKIASFVLTCMIIQIDRRYGRINSPVLFVFWLLMIVVNIIPFYTNIIEKVYESDELEFAMHCCLEGLLILQFLVFCFAEKTGRDGYHEVSKSLSSELTASLPSILTYWWMNKLVWTGYKKTLKEDDFSDLHPNDLCAHQVPKFEREWHREIENCAAHNRKYQSHNGDAFYEFHDKSLSLQLNEKTRLVPRKEDGGMDKKHKSPLKQPSLVGTMIRVYGFEVFCLQVTRTCFDLLNFATPKITEALLNFIEGERKDDEVWKGYVLASSYFVVSFITSICINQTMNRNKRVGMHIKSSLTAVIYRKSLTINNDAKKESSLGEIVNLMSVDCQRLENVMNYVYIILSAPCQVVIALYMLYDQIGYASLSGLGVILILLPLNVISGRFLRKYNRNMMTLKDKRIRLMNEILNGMKVLKVYAWELAFEQKVSKIRREEVKLIFKLAMIMSTISLFFQAVPYFAQVASFGVFILIDDYLSPTKAFVSISLFRRLNQTLTTMPMLIPFLVQAGVSLTRIAKFLRQPDNDPKACIKDPKSDAAVKVERGTFSWDKDAASPTLKSINIKIEPGSLVAVVGTVGSGKSSLLSAILGEMNKVKGQVTVKSSMAYVPQEAWIQNATLRDNIVFGTDYKGSLYEKVIGACALKSDLEILPGGDQTEIGEKGINISGGQKQRVSLARAVYSRADIYLLDDPLSAVDSHVGKHIFQEVIGRKGVLRDKTRVLVTHGVHWLPQVDSIIVMKGGQVSETGTYEQLVSHDGEFAQFLKEYFTQEAETEDEDKLDTDPEIEEMKLQVLQRLESFTGASSSDNAGKLLDKAHSLGRSISRRRSSTKPHKKGSQGEMPLKDGNQFSRGPGPQGTGVMKGNRKEVMGQKLVKEETAESGGVKTSVYKEYLRAVGYFSICISILSFVIYMASTIFASIWLSMWTDDKYLSNTTNIGTEEYEDKSNLYIGIYGGMGVVQAIFNYVFAVSVLIRTAVASYVLHNNMMQNIMRCPMEFFDTTPIGRIVNRFARDVDVLDSTFPNILRQSIGSLGRVLISLINISYSTPIVLSVIVPVIVLYVIVQRIYIPASRQIRRIDSNTRSPIYVHFSETLSGVASIRAYGAQGRFIQHSADLVDYNFKFYFASIVTSSWLSVRLEFLGNLIVLATAMFAQANTGLSAGLAGLAVSYAQQVTMALSNMIQVATQAETNIVSAERILEYARSPTEAAWDNPLTKPSKSWPEDGKMIFDNLQLRYREGLELVLRGISCDFRGGEKIGIVGRTGAGKSSLSVALFRLVEAANGKISIDDHRIDELGLHDLRSNITILPQDPVIFSGTLRMNLDPAEKYEDDQLWEALEHAHLKDFVQTLQGQLDFEAGEGGQNLSMGQRQLLCLARCLLRKSKILVLDEATAAVDMETDDLIQKTIRSEFKDCTVLTIAHRLNTIMDYDRVIVMDQGKISEMDLPQALLGNPDSIFYSMAKDANLV